MGPQEDFINLPNSSDPNVESINIAFYGGAAGGGKSYALLMDSLKYIDDPNYYAVYFRRTIGQLDKSLWPEAKEMYLPFLIELDGPRKGKYKGKAKIQEQKHRIIFPSGAMLDFSYLDNDKDAQLNWQGAQVTAVYWDEFCHFSEFQFNYLRTRLRSKALCPSFMRCSMNPDNSHHVYRWIEPYLDEDGYPLPELACKTRYFIFHDGLPVTFWSKEECLAQFPDKKPRTYTFVPSKLTDNRALLEGNEDYADELAANSKAERASLLDGCWNYQADEGSFFSREWLIKVPEAPRRSRTARAWDKASQVPTDTNRYPDYTASVKMHKDEDGFYTIVGDYCPSNKDAASDVYGRFRALPGDRDRLISNQCHADGDDCYVVLPVDPGAAGKVEFQQAAAKLTQEGFIIKEDPTPNNKSKLKRFEPFSAACQNGLVRIAESTFPNRATLDHFYKELEMFIGERSTATIKDDLADGAATCFNFLAKSKVIPSFTLPENNSSTAVTELRNLR